MIFTLVSKLVASFIFWGVERVLKSSDFVAAVGLVAAELVCVQGFTWTQVNPFKPVWTLDAGWKGLKCVSCFQGFRPPQSEQLRRSTRLLHRSANDRPKEPRGRYRRHPPNGPQSSAQSGSGCLCGLKLCSWIFCTCKSKLRTEFCNLVTQNIRIFYVCASVDESVCLKKIFTRVTNCFMKVCWQEKSKTLRVKLPASVWVSAYTTNSSFQLIGQ